MQKGKFQISACRLDVEKVIIIGAISIFEIQFEGATTTSRYPKGNFESQLAGLLLTAPLPDLHRAFSIFEIQFAGATTTSRYPKRNFRNSGCRLTVERSFPRSP